jgi:hypothetical protein
VRRVSREEGKYSEEGKQRGGQVVRRVSSEEGKYREEGKYSEEGE